MPGPFPYCAKRSRPACADEISCCAASKSSADGCFEGAPGSRGNERTVSICGIDLNITNSSSGWGDVDRPSVGPEGRRREDVDEEETKA
jgi:hypothetical protein